MKMSLKCFLDNYTHKQQITTRKRSIAKALQLKGRPLSRQWFWRIISIFWVFWVFFV